MKHPSPIPFAIGIAVAVLAIGVLAVNAADAVRPVNIQECVAEFLRVCSNAQDHASARSCVESNKSSFSRACLELAKGLK